MRFFLPVLAIISLALSGCAPAIMRAAQRGDAAGVKTELDKGADIETADANGTTLHQAIIFGRSEEVVRLLLDRGANPNSMSATNATPLTYVLSDSYYNPDIVRLLLERGADPTIKDSNGTSDYDFAMQHRLDRRPRITEVRSLITAAVANKNRERAAQEAAINPSAVPASAPAPARSPLFEAARLVPRFHAPEAKDDYAVVVGIESYSDLPPATNAERDADTTAAFIRALGVPDRNIVVIKGAKATRTGLVKNLETWLPNNVTPKSRVYFYFSGHGSPDPSNGDAYLVPSDGDPQYLSDSGYPLKRLYEKLNALKAREVIVALDACFTGAGGRSVIAKGTRPLVGKVDTGAGLSSTGKLTVFSASGPDQISGSDEGAGYGLFTYHWLEGLNGAAKNAAGEVTTQSLHDYLKPKVEDAARRANRAQSPQLLSGAAPVILRGR